VAACPTCGEDNPERAKFCLSCGAALGAVSARIADQRKVVTVLFCDLVGFTAASEAADPEDIRARIDPYFDRLTSALQAYGGTIEKFVGDAVQGVFGAPVAHEDDPERAVRAALRILDEIADLNALDPSLELTVRIGVNTGEALIRPGSHLESRGIVIGDVANIASRLQTVAPEGAIIVSESTYRATERVFDYEGLGLATIKGRAEPIPIWRAVAARARLGTDITRTPTGPMVGRTTEVRLLRDAFERTVRDRSVGLVTIVGEPGMGKSRLVAELGSFLDSVPDRVRWRQGRCLPYGQGITFWALGEIVKAETGILETDPPAVAGAKLDAAVLDDDPDAPWLRQRLRPLVGLDAPPAEREENFTAWQRFLVSLAATEPAVLVFEDLHWADDALLGFIERIVDDTTARPILIVATARPELFDRVPDWAAGPGAAASRITLSPLSEGDTTRLIGSLLEQAVLPADVSGTIVSRSAGNPLYAREFVRLLKDRRILTATGSTWTLDPRADIPVPMEVQGLITARLDMLDPDAKAMLQDAAVIGTVFWSGAVAAMGDRDPITVDEGLHALARSELILPARRSSMEGQTEYAFAHALIRDVCYGEIPRASRANRHVLAGAWIERTSGERVVDHAEILAAHYATALDLARAARGIETEQLEAKSVRYLTLAGDRAMGIDVEAAARRYAQALRLTVDGHVERPRVLARTAEALRQRGRFAEAAAAYDEAIEGFRAQGDVRALGVTIGRRWNLLVRLGAPRDQQLEAEAVAALEPLGPTPELAQAITERAGQCFVANEYQEAIAFADRAIALATELGLAEPARALGFRGAARAWLGDAGGLEAMRHALDAAADQGLGREMALLYNNIHVALWPIEGVRRYLEVAREGGAFAERRGIEEFAFSFASSTVVALTEYGSYHEAMAMARDLAPRLEAADDLWELVQVRAAEIRVMTRQGELAEAAWRADRAVEYARESAHASTLAQVLPAAAALRLAVGDTADALAILAEVERIPHARTEPNHAANLPDAVRTALIAGASDLAGRLVEGVDPIYPLHEHALTTARALLREHAGSHAEAAVLFADAAQRWQRFETPWEQAQALMGLGRCLMVGGRIAEATDVIRDARRTFVRLGGEPAVLAADALLEQAAAIA